MYRPFPFLFEIYMFLKRIKKTVLSWLLACWCKNNYPRAQIQKYNNYLGAHFALVLAHGSLRVLSMLWVEICTYLKNAVCGDVYFKKILWVEIYIRNAVGGVFQTFARWTLRTWNQKYTLRHISLTLYAFGLSKYFLNNLGYCDIISGIKF